MAVDCYVSDLVGGSMKFNKFILGGVLILAAVVYLIASSTQASAEYFMTVDEVEAKGADAIGKSLRISGAVIGDTIQYNADTLTLTFDGAQVSADNAVIEKQGGLTEVLYQAVIDPARQRIQVVYVGVKSDILRNEAQAIMTCKLVGDGNF